MPIAKKEVDALKKSLEEIKQELKVRFNVEIQFAEYRPKISSLFEYFVLYNTALSTNPRELKVNRFGRGNFRSTGFLPIPSEKSYRTVWRMGDTLKPSIITKNSKQLNFWFDRAIAKGLRPDIIVRVGKFETEEVNTSHIRLLKDGEIFAEYSDRLLEVRAGYSVETQKMNWTESEQSRIFFRAKEEFNNPELIIECKSFGARLGNPQKYANYAKQVIIVSPEPLYEPKAPNIQTIRIEREFNNLEIREKLRPFFKNIID
jgi:hypothetical protein